MSLFIGLNATSTATSGGLVYKGSYNATTNSPDLTSSTKGDFYIVSVAGTLAGVTLNVGDHIVFNQDASSPITSAMFDVIDNTDAVASVNGQTGPVVLDLQDINDVNASLSPSDSTFLVGDGSEWIGESGATARTSLGLGSAATLEAGANTANQLVQLTAAGKLPAVDGSLLTNLPGGGDMLSTNNLSDVADVTAARGNLGLTIGTNVQAFDAQLTDVAGLTPTDGNIIIGNGSNFITESGATARTSLGLGSAATLEAGANTANQLVQLTATGKLPAVDGSLLTNVTATDSTKLAIANDLSDLNDAGTARTHLGLEIGADVQAYDAQLADIAGLTPGDGAFIVGDGTNFTTETGSTVRTTLGLGSAALLTAGSSALNVVQLDSYAKLPAVDGSQLTNVTATSTDTLNDVVGRGATTSTPITVGDLKINSNAAGTSTSGSIATTSSNNNIKLDPHGTGVPELVGNSSRGSGQIKFNCEQNSHGIVLKGPPHSAGASYTMILPDGLGTAGQYLKLENASTGELAFDTPSGGGGGSVPTVTTDSTGSDSTISTYSGIEEVHLISNGSTAVTITIPAASTVGSGYKYNIKRLDTNNVTITTATPASDGQIDGSNTYVLVSNNESVTLVSDNSNYYII